MEFRDRNEIKIFILYLMWHINYPLDYSELNDVAVQGGQLNSFQFADCFTELLEAENVRLLREGGKDYYVITEQGKRVAENLCGSLSQVMREKSLRNALTLLSFRSRGAEARSEASKRDDGRYDVTFTITERGGSLLELKLTAETENQMKLMRYRFANDTENIYRNIMRQFGV